MDPRYIFVDENSSGAEWKHRHGWTALRAAIEDAPPPFGVVIVSELSRIGRDTVRTPAAVMAIEDAGVELRSYLNDAPISLADESSEIHTIFNCWPPASRGAEPGNARTMRSGVAPRPAPSRAAVSTATATSASAPATSTA